jgi:hypothetical protein
MKRIVIALLMLALPSSPANLLTIQKTAYESFNCGVDFTQVIGGDGTTLVSVTAVSGAAGAGGSDSTSAIIASSPVPDVVGSTDVVSFRVQGGAAQQTYTISVKVMDNVSGELYEGQITLKVLP